VFTGLASSEKLHEDLVSEARRWLPRTTTASACSHCAGVCVAREGAADSTCVANPKNLIDVNLEAARPKRDRSHTSRLTLSTARWHRQTTIRDTPLAGGRS
jgi:hypothetical protein